MKKKLSEQEVSQGVKDLIYDYYEEIVSSGDYLKHIPKYIEMLAHLSTYNPSAALLVDTLIERAKIQNPHFKFTNS